MTPRFEQQVKPLVDMRMVTPDDKLFKKSFDSSIRLLADQFAVTPKYTKPRR